MRLKSLRDLYLEELRSLYDAEQQLYDGLANMVESVVSPELKDALSGHLQQTKIHADRLEDIFKKLGESPLGNPSKTMSGLIAECRDLVREEHSADPVVLEAALIAAAQKIEHFEMAGYGCTRTFAELLGEKEAARILQQSLDEEVEANRLFNRIALQDINREAAEATSLEARFADATVSVLEVLGSEPSVRK